MHMTGLKSQETVKFLSGPYSAEWAIDCFLYFPPSFFLNTAINFLSYSDLGFFFSLFSLPPSPPTARFQLWGLQSRMRLALAAYLRLRGLHGQAGLARIQAASQENAQKILAVQVGDCREVGKIILI